MRLRHRSDVLALPLRPLQPRRVSSRRVGVSVKTAARWLVLGLLIGAVASGVLVTLVQGGSLLYQYVNFARWSDRAYESCAAGDLFRAREFMLVAMRYAPDHEANESARLSRRRFRYGDCTELPSAF